MPTAAEAMYPGGPKEELGNQPRYPQLSKEELEKWKLGPSSQGSFIARKKDPLDPYMTGKPDGFFVEPGHPGLKDIEGDADIFHVPDENYLFVRPKPQSQGVV
jgi:hypothetical protein